MVINIALLLIWLILGLFSCFIGMTLIFRQKQETSRRELEQIEKELLEDIFTIGVPELEKTRAGRQLLTLSNENFLGLVDSALNDYSNTDELANNALVNLHIVKKRESPDQETADANSLQALLRKAVDDVKPEEEGRFNSDWILYNILEMKFIEGRKVREVAGRLALSEADLYRKQRVAVEAVARAILDMERQEHKDMPETSEFPTQHAKDS
jgi:hypothetical protein